MLADLAIEAIIIAVAALLIYILFFESRKK